MDKIRIFAADADVAWITELCTHLCGKPNFEIVGTAQNGKDIITSLPDAEADILIIDAGIENPRGTEVLEAVGRIKFSRRPTVIATVKTGQCMLSRAAVKLGAAYCMVKPIDFSVLTERIIQFASISPQYTVEGGDEGNQSRESMIKNEITDIMHEIGMPAHIKAYGYVRSAVMMVLDDSELLEAVTKQLYPKIAKSYSSTNSRVERAIRHGIEIAFDRGDPKVLTAYFGNACRNGRRKPTNSEFIAMISDRIRLKTKFTEAQ